MRCAGARIAPTSSTCAWRHTRAENSGAKAAKTASIAAGRVGIVTPPGRVATSLPYLPPSLKWPKSSLEGGKRRSFYGKTRREAQDKLRAALRDIDAGLDLSADRQTVAQFLDKWLAASVKPSVKVRTYEGYESIVRVRVAPRIGKKQLTKLTPLDLQSLYTELADAGLSARSIGHTHRVLHRALGQAVKWNMLARNPCDGATAPRTQRTEMKVLTPEQVRAFLTPRSIIRRTRFTRWRSRAACGRANCLACNGVTSTSTLGTSRCNAPCSSRTARGWSS